MKDQLRDRCAQAIVERSQHTGLPMTMAQARLAYDVINELLAEAGPADHRDAGRAVSDITP